MSSTATKPHLKMKAAMAAADTNSTAIVPLRGGGIDRAFRCICVISADSTEPPADTKCQFSASLPHTRLPFQRELCN